MVRKKIVIDNPTGLHLRPAGTFCKAAIQFESKITVQKITKNENVTANANRKVHYPVKVCLQDTSIKDRDEIEIICEGEDEEEALQEMIRVVENELI